MAGTGEFLFSNGSSYIGLMAKDKMHGKGKFVFASGDSYVGEMKEDLMHGKGIFYFGPSPNPKGNIHCLYLYVLVPTLSDIFTFPNYHPSYSYAISPNMHDPPSLHYHNPTIDHVSPREVSLCTLYNTVTLKSSVP